MTREEFINHVLAACSCEIRDGKEWYGKDELIKCADDLYFKNPEYQSEDCISREYLKENMQKYGWQHPDSTVSEYVESLPSAQPILTKGKWLYKKEVAVNTRGQILYEARCSECNALAYFRGCGEMLVGANTCPNCRTNMKEKKK